MLNDFRYFFLISRPLNVLIAVAAFTLACFLVHPGTPSFFFDPLYWSTALTIAAIATTGYWINDVYDFRIDRVNKPEKTIINAFLSVKKVLTAYFVATGAILLFSVAYLGLKHGKWPIPTINLLSVLLLFLYAARLKRIGIPGNLVISFLISTVLVLAGYLYEVSMPLLWACLLAFIITFLREIVKDAEDIRGDLRFNLKTLPIQIGLRRTRYVVQSLYIVLIVACIMPFVVEVRHDATYNWPYLIASVALVQIPSVYLIVKAGQAFRKKDYARQSAWLKGLMITGMVTLFFL